MIGVYTKDECHIDLGKLSSFCGARLIIAEACGIDRKLKLINTTDGRPPINYDICSIDIGIKPVAIPIIDDTRQITTTSTNDNDVCEDNNVTPVKPISSFSGKWKDILERISILPRYIYIYIYIYKHM